MASGSARAEYEYYRRIKLLGEGAFGKAYLVECVSDGSKCVIKQMDLKNMSEEEKRETYKEARILEALKHPNIIKFREVYSTKQGKICIVMDYADGGDLSKKIQEMKNMNSRFSENQILDWFTQICLALKHVHDRKILHRDLKSQNIFLTRDNTIKLGDFGIARILSSTYEKAKTMVGTPYYLSPEIIENMPYSFKSDIWSLGVILYEMCSLEPPFNAESLSCLALRICRGVYSPISSYYSKDLRNLVTILLQSDSNKRPSVHQILKMPVITNRIKNFLSESIKIYEFSHTILHKKKFVDLKELSSEPKQEQNIGPKGFAHYQLSPYNNNNNNNNNINLNLAKNNPNAMDFLPPKKELQYNNLLNNNNNNVYVSPKNDLFFKESPITQQRQYKNDFVEKRKHAISPSPRYRENYNNNFLNNNSNNNEKFVINANKKESKPIFKPDNNNFKPFKDNFNNLLPPTSNRNKDVGIKTPFKEQRDQKEVKKELKNNNSYQELISKNNEVCITEPNKASKKTTEQKFEQLKKKYNIKDKEEDLKKGDSKEKIEKNRENERKQMMNDIEKKRSVNRKKSEELIIEWVGPIKPKKENSSENKQICSSEGKENNAKLNEKKQEFSNFEINFEDFSDVEEEEKELQKNKFLNSPLQKNNIQKNNIEKINSEKSNHSDKISKNNNEKSNNNEKNEKNVENEIFEGLRNEISEKINLCTERETEISQILIELQDIVSGKDLLEEQGDFENKMKTIKEDEREEREDDNTEMKENGSDQKNNVSKKIKAISDDKENAFKNSNVNAEINLKKFLEEIFGRDHLQIIQEQLKEKLKSLSLVDLNENYGKDSFSSLFPFVKKEDLEKNSALLVIYALMESENI